MHREPPDFVDRVFRNGDVIVADTGTSKLFRDTSLSQHRVRGVPGQDSPVHGETSLRHRTVPDFVVTFGLAARSDIHAHEESPSRSGCNWPSEGQDATIFVLVQHVETRGPVAGGTVQL